MWHLPSDPSIYPGAHPFLQGVWFNPPHMVVVVVEVVGVVVVEVAEIDTFLSGKDVVPKLSFISDRVVLPELRRFISMVIFGLGGLYQKEENRNPRTKPTDIPTAR